MTREEESGDDDGEQPPHERVVLIANTPGDARIIRDYLRDVSWLEVSTEIDKSAA